MQRLVEESEFVRFIDDVDGDGAADRPLPDHVGESQAVELLRGMVLLRVYDERLLTFQRHGRIGTFPLLWGCEALQAGVVAALRDTDWVVPSYRDSGVALLRGMPAGGLVSLWRGHPAGCWNPHDLHVAPLSIPVGSHIPHAVGVAWGGRLQGRDDVAVAMFGDGATSEGDFHEGANFASVYDLPVVLLCNNNQWAISTPLSRQTGARKLSDKAVGYGMHGVRVDGNDVLAVVHAVREAAERGRAGGGPTFIEAVSYRPTLHATADDPDRYREDEEAKRWRHNNCIARYEAYLRRLGLVDDAAVAAMREEALDVMATAIREAEAMPMATPEDMFGTAYAQAPEWFARDEADLRASLEVER